VSALASLLGPEARIEQAWSDSLHDLPMMRLAQRRVWLCPPADPVAVRRADPEGVVVAPRSAPS
jgi:phosphoserine phosphatase